MTTLLVPPRVQFTDVNGNPLAGGKVWTYEAGTSNPKVTYTDSTGTVQNTNPVILNAAGEANIWIRGAYKIRVENSAGAERYTIDNIIEYTTFGSANVFTDAGVAPTTLSASSFSVPGNLITLFQAGTRIKYTTTNVIRYGTVSATPIFGSGMTTVLLEDTDGTLLNGTGVSVAYGNGDVNKALNTKQIAHTGATNLAVALDGKLNLTGGTVTGRIIMQNAVQFAKTADVSAGTSINLATLAGNVTDFDGNLNISNIFCSAGEVRFIRCKPVTNNFVAFAPSATILNANSVVLFAGDIGVIYGVGTNQAVVAVLSRTKGNAFAQNQFLVTSNLVNLSTANANVNFSATDDGLVVVWGTSVVDPVAAGVASVEIALPAAFDPGTNFATASDAAGGGGDGPSACSIGAVVGSKRVKLTFTALGTAATMFYYCFAYQRALIN